MGVCWECWLVAAGLRDVVERWSIGSQSFIFISIFIDFMIKLEASVFQICFTSLRTQLVWYVKSIIKGYCRCCYCLSRCPSIWLIIWLYSLAPLFSQGLQAENTGVGKLHFLSQEVFLAGSCSRPPAAVQRFLHSWAVSLEVFFDPINLDFHVAQPHVGSAIQHQYC